MILVTGASGTVGSEVLKALVARRAPVRAGYRTRRPELPAGVEAVPLDYDRPETIRPALEGVGTIFLISTTVAPEKKVVDAARRAGVRRVVKLSALRAVEEEFVFGRWHRAVEKHIEASGLAWTFLRPNGFMQNVVTYMAGTIRSHAAIYSSAGNGAVSHVDVRDLAAVGAAVLAESGHEGQAYDLTGPAALTYTQVAEILSRVLARPIRYVPISPEQYKQGALAAGTPETYADALVDLNRYYAEGKMSEITPTLRLLSGRDPTPFEQFARDHAELLR
ncbi:MAG: NAD(P)-dependent oxidoreductase [Acidobacteria bacterium]|nr:MAG: NAD(P)-dependent oxidoreductase [Acidobacteriota bacterium]